LVATYITPILPIFPYICSLYFYGYFEFFALSEISAISYHNTYDISWRTGRETSLTLTFTGVRPTARFKCFNEQNP
jgi:hypothetical protein